ncbi:sigma-70 family RNA polymerase sigma factor [Myceligenerans crystallogenes]|uniref:Sigma-70 family RNA polymerase sigma factor n=1 Tax=Myceligenerans crystallogenes TaxID=316335 RepID=A0ABN2N7W8_9MICO
MNDHGPPAGTPAGTTTDAARDELLGRLRPLSFAVAYRMLGSVTEAEDVVQEALWKVSRQTQEPEGLRNPEGFVTTVTTRLAINVLRSARARRETYVGPWLPEPLVSGPAGRPGPVAVAHATAPPDAAAHAELADELSTAFLVVLETLSPTERAAFLLHDVLGYPHGEAAEIIGTSVTSARQLASRARRRITERRSAALERTPARQERDDARRLVERFLAAVEHGDVDEFVDLLAEDVVFTGDGGGNVPRGLAFTRPFGGREHVARAIGGYTQHGEQSLVRLVGAEVGGAPGLLVMAGDEIGGGLFAAMSVDVAADDTGRLRITALHSVVNPEKLGHLGPLADLGRLAAAVHELRGHRRGR